MTSDELSGFAIVICFAVGVMAVVELFIFAKRQIMRFTLKSRRGPHYPIGSDAGKSLRKEIERRLDAVKEIKFEPKLLAHSDKRVQNNQNLPHYWRMKAVDQLELLEEAIAQTRNRDPEFQRPPRQDLRYFLVKMTRENSPLHGCETRLIHQFVDAYVHARHEPTPDFSEQEYNNYLNLLNRLRSLLNETSASKSLDPTDPSSRKSKDTRVALNGKAKYRLMGSKTDENAELDSETRV